MKTTSTADIEKAMERDGVRLLLLAENELGVYESWPGPEYKNVELAPRSPWGGHEISATLRATVLARYQKYQEQLSFQTAVVTA